MFEILDRLVGNIDKVYFYRMIFIIERIPRRCRMNYTISITANDLRETDSCIS